MHKYAYESPLRPGEDRAVLPEQIVLFEDP